MSSEGSVTHWISLLKAGEEAAAQPLWDAYCRRLAGLARQYLQHAPRQAADEEDAALSAFASFCRRAEGGQFSRLHDRNDLWQLLVVLTARKALQLRRKACREKRGGGKVLLEADLAAADGSGEDALARVVGREPTPEFMAQVAEELRSLLGRLPDPELRAIALWKMDGYTNDEIAARLEAGSCRAEGGPARARRDLLADRHSARSGPISDPSYHRDAGAGPGLCPVDAGARQDAIPAEITDARPPVVLPGGGPARPRSAARRPPAEGVPAGCRAARTPHRVQRHAAGVG
jgi:DNA-directed RNA polymerase specialized sigma24 family protein